MGEIIEFPSNGSPGQGYIAIPTGGAAETVAVIVIQEWWGLVDQIKHTCDRFAAAGFTALAPDLYHGTTVPLTEPDEAGKQMMALKMDTAAQDLSGAVDELVRRTGGATVGVIGFCMGGGLALVLATQRPDAVKAVVPAYGLIPWPDARPDYSPVGGGRARPGRRTGRLLHPGGCRGAPGRAQWPGQGAELHVYPDAGHAFFNEDRPEAHHEESAELLWDRTVAFFRRTLAAGAH